MYFSKITSRLSQSVFNQFRYSVNCNQPCLVNHLKAPLTTLSKPFLNTYPFQSSNLLKLNCSRLGQCASSTQSRSTPLDKELSSFLEEEIRAEKAQLTPSSGVNGFEIESNGAELVFKKIFKNENIRIKVNVNGSVAGDESTEPENNEPENFMPEMTSKPDFAVEIRKPNGQALCIHCIFTSDDRMLYEPNEQEAPEVAEDIFEIDNFVVTEYKGNNDIVIEDNVYFGDASIVDGQLYDLLMDYLEERGINNEFAAALTSYCTSHEHRQYVDLLNKLKKFVESK